MIRALWLLVAAAMLGAVMLDVTGQPPSARIALQIIAAAIAIPLVLRYLAQAMPGETPRRPADVDQAAPTNALPALEAPAPYRPALDSRPAASVLPR